MSKVRPEISTASWLLETLFYRSPGLGIRLGNWETRWLEEELHSVTVTKPVYICGLARSGTTILLEFLSRLPDVATHRYRDFPPVTIPYWWNRLLDMLPRTSLTPTERAHRDGLHVTAESPEAMEEPLWTAFFPDAHTPGTSHILDAATDHPAFAAFYRDHVRKVLYTRGGTRYVAKGNYHLTRMAYLHTLFPDARFIIPMRDPVWHIASLMKQHRLFCKLERANPRVLTHMQRMGHFEFGLDRRPINAGDGKAVEEIQALWEKGEEVRGWARYWSFLYRFVHQSVIANPALRKASMIVHYEKLCRTPEETLRAVMTHSDFTGADDIVERFAATIHLPVYYSPDFNAQERDIIHEETSETAALFM